MECEKGTGVHMYIYTTRYVQHVTVCMAFFRRKGLVSRLDDDTSMNLMQKIDHHATMQAALHTHTTSLWQQTECLRGEFYSDNCQIPSRVS